MVIIKNIVVINCFIISIIIIWEILSEQSRNLWEAFEKMKNCCRRVWLNFLTVGFCGWWFFWFCHIGFRNVTLCIIVWWKLILSIGFCGVFRLNIGVLYSSWIGEKRENWWSRWICFTSTLKFCVDRGRVSISEVGFVLFFKNISLY